MGVNGASLVCAVVLKGRKEEQRRRILPVQRLLPRGAVKIEDPEATYMTDALATIHYLFAVQRPALSTDWERAGRLCRGVSAAARGARFGCAAGT